MMFANLFRGRYTNVNYTFLIYLEHAMLSLFEAEIDGKLMVKRKGIIIHAMHISAETRKNPNIKQENEKSVVEICTSSKKTREYGIIFCL